MEKPRNDGGKSDETPKRGNVTKFRRILPQVIATTIKNFHMMDWGFTVGITSIMIPALTGIPNQRNQGEFLSITAVQSSWLVSISYATQMLGSSISGVVTDKIGRKPAMLFVNIPFAIGWILLYQATEIWHIFLGLAVLGMAVGVMEASVVCYVGEICEPSVRGILLAYTGMAYTASVLVIYFLNTLMPWRTVALFCLLVPITCAMALIFVPETPQWLLAKQRNIEAEKSLRWLRGWTTKKAVAHEFYELKRHSERSNPCKSCIEQDLHCLHPPTIARKLSGLKRKRALKPFTIVMLLFFLVQFTGVTSTSPFIAQILKAYESPISIDQTMMILGVSKNLANIILLCLIRCVGKRRIYLTVLFGIFISWFIISCYGFIYLPKGFVSFNQQDQLFRLDNPNLAYIPMIALIVMNFCEFCGFLTIPWMMLSELFSFESRGIASSVVASINYILAFLSKKTYYNFEMTLSIAGVSLLYSVISGVGLVLMYFILPETEGRTLEDIELHFSDNSKKLTDRIIAKKQQLLLTQNS